MKPCCHPVWISVPDLEKGNYLGTKKYKHIQVPCRKCVNCRKNYQKDWIFRLLLENEVSEYSCFVTLTFDDDNYHQISKKELSQFVRLFRQKINREAAKYDAPKLDIRYYGCGEYGKKTNRGHYHLILFNLPIHNNVLIHNIIKSVWKKGFVYVEDCNYRSIAYISKYITKYDPRPHEVPPFRINEFASSYRSKVFFRKKGSYKRLADS